MSYIATSTGKHIDFTNITPDQICIEDIARGLSNECRFAGQLESFYSVAQHSVYVSQIVPPEYALEALLHDAAETYIKDIPSPLKVMLPDYKAVEKRIEAVIREKFGLPPVMTVDVHYADLVMLATEKRDFEIDPASHWPMLDSAPPHDDIIIQPLTPPQAYHQFMARFEMLISGKQQKTISYIKPERDSDGYWVHPDIPCLESNQEIEQWCDENNLEHQVVYCCNDIDNFHSLWFSYFEEGDTNISAWEPTKPDGDGWFIAWIAGNEDGPICMWVRPKNL